MQIEQLQKALQGEKEKNTKSWKKMVLLSVLHSSNPMRIRKLTVSPEDWDGDIWGDPDDYDVGYDDLLFPSDSSEYETRPTIKVE